MRILAIANNVKRTDGWGRYASSIAEQYAALNLDFVILTHQKKNPPEQALHELPQLFPHTSPLNFLRNLWRVRKLARNANIIHAFDGWPYSIYAYAAVFGTAKKLFITGVGTYSVAPFNHVLQGYLLGRAYRRAKKIFCISNYTRNEILKKIQLTNMVIVHWGRSPLPLVTPAEGDALQKKFSIPSGAYPIIVTTGQIKHRKGQLDTLRAVARLQEHYPRCLYIMVGSDRDQAYIQAINHCIAERHLENNTCIVSNATEDKDLAFFYNLATIFAMNSNNEHDHFEGFGLVFLEAGQFGKPAIGSRDCGIEDAIEDGYNGYLTRQGDEKDIYEKMMLIIKQKPESFAARAKEFAERFSWKKTAEAHVYFYAE